MAAIVSVIYSGRFRKLAGKEKEEVQLPHDETMTVFELVKRLGVFHGREFNWAVIDECGVLCPCVMLVVNESIQSSKCASLKLQSGDIVMFMEPISGG